MADSIGSQVSGLLTQTDPGTENNSDFHLKHVEDLLDKMKEKQLGQIFIKWREHPGAAVHYPHTEYPAAGFGKEETELLNDLKGIRWGMLRAASDRLGNLAGTRNLLVDEVKNLRGRLDSAWQGKAAGAALESYHGTIGPINEYCDAVKKFSDDLGKAAAVPRRLFEEEDNILSNPKHNSGFWKHYGDMENPGDMMADISGMAEYLSYYSATPQQVKGMGAFGQAILPRIVRDVVEYHNVSYEYAKNSDYVGDINLTWDELRLHGSPDCRRTLLVDTPSWERIEWLDTFTGWYAHDIDFLRRRIRHAWESIFGAWNALSASLNSLNDDPFGKGQSGGDAQPHQERPPQPSPGQTAPAGTPSAGPAPSGGGVAGAGPGLGAGGGGSFGGGGGVAAGAPSAPTGMPQASQMPQPPRMPQPPEMPDQPGADESGPASEDGADPAGPEAPQTPQPDMFLASEPRGEQVTLGEGQSRITIAEPAPDGSVSLTVVGQNGPETYEIDFGQQPVGMPDQVAGQQTLPGQVAGQPMPGGPTGGGSWTEASASGQETPLSPAFQPGTGPTQISAGSDGQAVIELADRTITVDQVPSGGLQVTVDSGAEGPRSYTVDFGEDRPAADLPPTSAMPFEQAEPVASASGSEAADVPSTASQPAPPDSSEPGPRASEPSDAVPAASEPAASEAASFESAAFEPAGERLDLTGSAIGEQSVGQSDPFEASTVDDGAPEFGTATDSGSTADLPASTTLQWGSGFSTMSAFADEGMQNSFASMSGSLPTTGGNTFLAGDTTSSWGNAFVSDSSGASAGAVGLASMDRAESSSSQGATGLAAMGGASGDAGSNEQGAAMRGGMMPMGGMGAGGQQGGDEERSNDSPWRTQGDLFDDGIEPDGEWRYQSVFGDGGQQK